MRVAVRHAGVRYTRHVAVTAQPGRSLALQEHVSERQGPLERGEPANPARRPSEMRNLAVRTLAAPVSDQRAHLDTSQDHEA